jgi:arginyl-tRNA synthetase
MRESLKANPKKAAPLGGSDESAAAIGISTLLAQELLAKRATDRPFAIDKMTSFGRGTGPELRHWHARLCSILRAESSDLTALSDEDFAPIEEEKYTELLRMLGQYPDTTNSAYKALEPPTVMLYLVSVTDQLLSASRRRKVRRNRATLPPKQLCSRVCDKSCSELRQSPGESPFHY